MSGVKKFYVLLPRWSNRNALHVFYGYINGSRRPAQTREYSANTVWVEEDVSGKGIPTDSKCVYLREITSNLYCPFLSKDKDDTFMEINEDEVDVYIMST